MVFLHNSHTQAVIDIIIISSILHACSREGEEVGGGGVCVRACVCVSLCRLPGALATPLLQVT